MINYKLLLAYDGKEYHGWQRNCMGPSIEETLQTVLEQILQHPIALQAASRTDAGVHALNQVVNFFSTKELDLKRLIHSLNSLLPKDIVISSIEKTSPSFHPTLDCIGKEYRYHVCYGAFQPPHQRFYEWHVHYPLNIMEMKQTLPFFIGEHDFSAFCNFKKNAHYTNTIRRVDSLIMEERPEKRLLFIIQGNHFLYKMVRNIVGTLVDVGKGKIAKEQIPFILTSQKRILAGVTAPAHGLFLQSVFYT